MNRSGDPTHDADLEGRARTLFDAVVDLDEEGRRRELARGCDGDAELRERVERLLDGDRGDGAFLASPFWEASLQGRLLGRYRIGERIGEGGSGAVYLAERVEGDFAHRVAVKFLKRAVDSEASRRRFERERTILAGLSHAGIASLLDGGTTDDGVPFVVMEYVEGSPITAHCDAARLAIADRLRLLQRVCDAVAYAHAALVVHRDLKPGNILVTRQGAPKLLDFGIAKLLEPDTDPTTSAERVLTLRYASPEQRFGGAVTTASDVYSLGVLLHELLVGEVPAARSTPPAAGLDRAAGFTGFGEFVPPSRNLLAASASADPEARARTERIARERSTRPAALVREIAGDLDQIVRRCLETDPRDRYPGPAELARDLERYLTGLPVTARPLPLFARGAKFARRRPDAALLVGAILLLAAFGAAQTVRWAAARDAAARDRRARSAVEAALVDSLRMTGPERELVTSISAREVLDRAAARVDRMAESPQAQVALATTIADGYLDLGLYPLARERFERAATLVERLPEGSRGEAAALVAAGRSRALVRLGEAAEAASAARARLDSDDAGLPPAVRAKLRVAYAEAALELHELNEAESSSRQAFDLLERSDAGDSREAFAALDVLTRTLEAKGDLVAAEKLARDTIAGLDRRGGADRVERTTASTNLGLILYRRGDAPGAETILREVVRRRRAELPPRHPALADALNNLGMVEITLGRTDEADALLLEALSIWRETLVPTHQLLADVNYNLGYLRRRERRLDEADAFLRASLAISERRYEPGHPNLAGNYSSLGWLALDRGWPRSAEVDFERAIAAAERSAEPDRIRLSIGLVGRAVSRIYLGRLSTADADVERALVALGAGVPTPPNAAAASALFARCQIGLLVGDLERADASCAAGIDQLLGSVGPTNIWVLELRAHRAFVDVARGEPEAAAAALAPLLDAIASATGDDPGAALSVRFLRALALAASERDAEAEPMLETLVRESTPLFGAEHPDTLRIRLELAALRLRRGERPGAERELDEIARAARERLGDGTWLADAACLLADRPGAKAEVGARCPGAEARIDAAFPAATAQPRRILEANGRRLVRSAAG